MSLITPEIYSPISPFPATSDKELSFYVQSGGSQVTQHKVIIQKNSDSTEVYNQTIQSFLYKITIPQNTLQNGILYKIKIATGDVNNNYSSWSDWVTFYCFSVPSVSITNLTTVNNQTYTLQGSYSQTESEAVNSYRFIIYDENQVELESFDEVYSTTLTQEIVVDNGITYYARLITLSINGLQGDSGLLEFTPNYIQPRLNSVLTLTNLPSQGSIQCQANVIQIIGQTYPTSGVTLTYESNDIVDLTDGNQVIFDEGFTCDSNFIMKIWCKTLTDNQTFLTLYGDYGRIEFKLYQNKIHAYKYYNNCDICSHFASNELTSIQSTDNLFVWVKQINNLMDIQIEILI